MDVNYPKENELRAFVRNYIAENLNGEYPQDEWATIGENWDINMYTRDGELLFTLYPVIGGNTIASIGICFTFIEVHPVPTEIPVPEQPQVQMEVVEEIGRAAFKARVNFYLRKGFMPMSEPTIFYNSGHTKFIMSLIKEV